MNISRRLQQMLILVWGPHSQNHRCWECEPEEKEDRTELLPDRWGILVGRGGKGGEKACVAWFHFCLALSPAICETLGKLLNLSGPLFLPL
jgi:hypothetical protein